MKKSLLDTLFSRSAENLALRTSRRSFLFRTTVGLGLFASAGILLPIRRTAAAQTVQPCNSGNCCRAQGKNNDPRSTDYWMYAGINGKPCALGCCGATATGCPATVPARGGGARLNVVYAGCWVTAVPDCDGKMQCVAYRDCCTHTSMFRETPCEEDETKCKRIGGLGFSWCVAGRVDPVNQQQICPSAPGTTSQREITEWHALCTHAVRVRAARPGETDCAPGPRP